MSRRPLVAGNWKMFKTRGEALAFADGLKRGLGATGDVEIAICPPFTSLDVVASALAGSGVGVFGQNGHEDANGAHTGEIAMGMLVDAGATGVLLGHSERRADNNETDQSLARKVPAALAAGLTPVLCIGESEFERDAGTTKAVLDRQVLEGLSGVEIGDLPKVVDAYEPIWAIGTGKSATPEIAQEAHGWIRTQLRELCQDAAEQMRILYGGSVKPDNAVELLTQPDIDGALVGGASLEPDSLLAIAAAAAS
ncbi:MAG: triose-phosphate isomerase [Gaiellales bacterium]